LFYILTFGCVYTALVNSMPTYTKVEDSSVKTMYKSALCVQGIKTARWVQCTSHVYAHKVLITLLAMKQNLRLFELGYGTDLCQISWAIKQNWHLLD
jgi:hypothetical protein